MHARAKGGGGVVFEAAYYGTKVAVKEVFKQVTERENERWTD
jgi:hypothetical protein